MKWNIELYHIVFRMKYLALFQNIENLSQQIRDSHV